MLSISHYPPPVIRIMRAHRLLPPIGSFLFKSQYQSSVISTLRSKPPSQYLLQSALLQRTFSSTSIWRRDQYADQAKALNQKGQDNHEAGFDRQIDESIGEAKELQARTPWHREGSDQPPVKRMRNASAMTKGLLRLQKFRG